MKEFIDKLIGRLEEYKTKTYVTGITNDAYEFGACSGMDSAIKIVNELAEEYNNDFCEWKYDGIMYDRCPHTETLFARIHNCDEKIFKYCPYCGKKIKVVK